MKRWYFETIDYRENLHSNIKTNLFDNQYKSIKNIYKYDENKMDLERD